MKQVNIYAMDAIVNELANGKTISDALKAVFDKRTVQICYNDADFNIPVAALGMSRRTTNSLMRNGIHTIADLANYSMNDGIQNIRGCGKDSITEIMETILNYVWDHMTEKEKVKFLIDTVNLNEYHLKNIF